MRWPKHGYRKGYTSLPIKWFTKLKMKIKETRPTVSPRSCNLKEKPPPFFVFLFLFLFYKLSAAHLKKTSFPFLFKTRATYLFSLFWNSPKAPKKANPPPLTTVSSSFLFNLLCSPFSFQPSQNSQPFSPFNTLLSSSFLRKATAPFLHALTAPSPLGLNLHQPFSLICDEPH